ncbi:DUF5129 domain-containing protein [Brevibacterium sp. 91QC2O2]|uniref:DUF5129 domain-containing protein n=1 Tax=Brevibacterium sp. 91QC2O2 TaxID=2968458 RepID=UPI00211C2FEF|nr:DUF5129 domain-containing protein [Brevibacterium sp. 91QC2O2]MCQ9367198.1 DUF5129 domain-containing protein [Brevibacterium sp. 91QC2O2]
MSTLPAPRTPAGPNQAKPNRTGTAGVFGRVISYVLLSLVILGCLITALGCLLARADPGYPARSVEVASTTGLVDAPELEARLRELPLNDPGIDVLVIAQQGSGLSDIDGTALDAVSATHPGWVSGGRLGDGKMAVFLNITDPAGHGDSGLYVGSDQDDSSLQSRREAGNGAFHDARWNDGLVDIVRAQAGVLHPGIGTFAIIAGVAVAAVGSIVWIAVVAHLRRGQTRQNIAAGRAAAAHLAQRIPALETLMGRAEQANPEAAPGIVRDIRLATAALAEPAGHWEESLTGLSPARARSGSARDATEGAAAQLTGLRRRTDGLADVALLAGGLPGWQDAAARQAELLGADARAARDLAGLRKSLAEDRDWQRAAKAGKGKEGSRPPLACDADHLELQRTIELAENTAERLPQDARAGRLSPAQALGYLDQASATLAGSAARIVHTDLTYVSRRNPRMMGTFDDIVTAKAGKEPGPTVGRVRNTVASAAVLLGSMESLQVITQSTGTTPGYVYSSPSTSSSPGGSGGGSSAGGNSGSF